MDDPKSSTEITISEIRRLLDEFETKFKDGTSDPDNFITFSEIEEMLGKLIGSTKDLYSDKLSSMLNEINEKELIRKKKENTPNEE